MPRRSLALLLAFGALGLAASTGIAGPKPGASSSASGPRASAAPPPVTSASAAKKPESVRPKATPAPKPTTKNRARAKPKPKPPKPCSPRWRPYVPQSYRAAVLSWHRSITTPARTDAHGRPFLTLEILNTNERLELAPQVDSGGFAASDLDKLAHAMRDTRRGNEHPIDPALADLVYDVQKHFKAHGLRVISGYRTPSGPGHSNHGRGRAMDLIVPGVVDEEVAKYVRAKGFTGVGIYPSSGFVHVDVRPVSYYWVDNSGPGQKNCEKSTLGTQARANDALALAHGRRPPRPWSEPSSEVDATWGDRRQRELLAEPHEDAAEEDDLDSDHD